jgi:hypothetical protein
MRAGALWLNHGWPNRPSGRSLIGTAPIVKEANMMQKFPAANSVHWFQGGAICLLRMIGLVCISQCQVS